MTNNRLDVLRGMVAANPNDSFTRYGLAMECVNTGKLQDAVVEFNKLLEINANYAAAYFHGGQALEKLGKLEDARALYQKGIEVTTATGDLHTRSELQAALDIL